MRRGVVGVAVGSDAWALGKAGPGRLGVVGPWGGAAGRGGLCLAHGRGWPPGSLGLVKTLYKAHPPRARKKEETLVPAFIDTFIINIFSLFTFSFIRGTL